MQCKLQKKEWERVRESEREDDHIETVIAETWQQAEQVGSGGKYHITGSYFVYSNHFSGFNYCTV